MKIRSERAKLIDSHLEGDQEVGRWPIEIGGEKNVLPYYRFPISLLCYSANNGRLAVDRRRWEADEGRQLDGCRGDDAAIIREMLLKLDEDKAATLKEDIRKKGQMEPGVISHDGVVINGNRRMAVIEELHEEEPTGKWTVLEAVRLPPTIGEQDLWRIEAGLQLSKDKVMEYHPVNELLKLREGADRGLSPEEIAAAMYAWKPSAVEAALGRLTLIDNFLLFHGQRGNYGMVKKFGLHEYFIDIQKTVIAPAERAGLPSRERLRRVKHAFCLIQAHVRVQGQAGARGKGITHWDIRKLHKIYSDPYASEAFVGPLEQAAKLEHARPEVVIEGLRDSIDILRMREERHKPTRLIEKAINALRSIDTESEHFVVPPVREAMQTLAALVGDMLSELTEVPMDE